MYLYLEGGPNSGLSKTWEREMDEYIYVYICVYVYVSISRGRTQQWSF